MRRVIPSLWWFLFVPYFWVKSLNSRPFFTEDREFANRVHGLIVLGMILTFTVFGVLNVTRWRHVLDSTVFDLGVYGAACGAAAAAISRNRERQYAALYQVMPNRKRRAIGFAVLVLFAVAFIASMPPSDERAAGPEKLTCPVSADETTAECS
jgi:hypothetical protein